MEDFRALIKARRIISMSFIMILKLDKYDPLRNQASRSAISVVSNLAEGNQRRGKDRNQLFLIAKGSLAELEEQLRIIGILYEEPFENTALQQEITELHKIIYSLTLQSSPSQSHSQSGGK